MLKPVAVIRKVEDSPEYIDRRLVEAYLRTAYSAPSTGLPPVRVGALHPLVERWLDEKDYATFAFITAWNPFSGLAEISENQLNNKSLEDELRLCAHCVLPGLGAGDDGAWPAEESFWTLGISAEDAIRLGRKYGQNAIVWWENGEAPALWWLHEVKITEL